MITDEKLAAVLGKTSDELAEARIRYSGCENCKFGRCEDGSFCTCAVGLMLRDRSAKDEERRKDEAQEWQRVALREIQRDIERIVPPLYVGITWKSIFELAQTDVLSLEAARTALNFGKNAATASGKKSLLITGHVGTGKTTIAMRLLQDRIMQRVDVYLIELYYWLSEIGVMSYEDREGQILKACRAPFMVIDDLGHLQRDRAESAYHADIVAKIINARYSHMLPTVITTNLNAEEMAQQFGRPTAGRIAMMTDELYLPGNDLRPYFS